MQSVFPNHLNPLRHDFQSIKTSFMNVMQGRSPDWFNVYRSLEHTIAKYLSLILQMIIYNCIVAKINSFVKTV